MAYYGGQPATPTNESARPSRGPPRSQTAALLQAHHSQYLASQNRQLGGSQQQHAHPQSPFAPPNGNQQSPAQTRQSPAVTTPASGSSYARPAHAPGPHTLARGGSTLQHGVQQRGQGGAGPAAATQNLQTPPNASSAHTPQTRATGSKPAPAMRKAKAPPDGSEQLYLEPGPSNRLYLSLRSGIPSQIDWALSRLTHASFHYGERLQLDGFAGLTDVLLSWPRRVCAAVHGEPRENWEIGFEQDATDLVSDPATGETLLSQEELGAAKRARTTLAKLAETFGPEPPSARLGGLVATTLGQHAKPVQYTFDPAHNSVHGALLRRALEAALVLRNASLVPHNARHLVASRGMLALVRDVLELPEGLLGARMGDSEGEVEEWLELDGVHELRLYFLDMLEGLAPKIHLTQRANFSVAITGSAKRKRDDIAAAPSGTAGLRSADMIFARLLHFVHYATDRALLVAALRVLSVLAANERNETAFIEAELDGGRSLSPGLVRRCVELLPLTKDPELLEAALDLLYQLVGIPNNALRLGLGFGSSFSTSASTSESSSSCTVAAAVRLLVRNFGMSRVTWERDTRLAPNPATARLPSIAKAEAEKRRAREEILRRESPAERAARKRLTKKELDAVKELPEPKRSIAWMRIVYEAKPDGEVTQMEFWQSYKDEFTPLADAGAAPLQPAAELIRNVNTVFDGAAAMVIPARPGPGGGPQRFVIRGVVVRNREAKPDPFPCRWLTCPDPGTTTLSGVTAHAITHANHSPDGKCKWANCTYVAPSSAAGLSLDQRRALLRAHVRTHLPAGPTPAKKEEQAAALNRPYERPTIASANGARYISRPGASGSSIPGTPGTPGALFPTATPISAPSAPSADQPEILTYTVERTPMDPHGYPMGIAYTSALILRALARSAAAVLDRAGAAGGASGASAVGGRRTAGGSGNASRKPGASAEVGGNEMFGFPLPVGDLDMTGTSGDNSSAPAGIDGAAPTSIGLNLDSVQNFGSGSGGKGEELALASASRIMDALTSVEEELVRTAGSNDVLCPHLGDTLAELRSKEVESLVGEGEEGELEGLEGAEALHPALVSRAM